MSGETGPQGSADFLGDDTIASLAEKLAALRDQAHGKHQQAIIGILVRMLTNPIEKLKLRGGDARFSEEEEVIIRALERDRGR